MKICVISSTVIPCLPLTDPANGYNGLEQVVWHLTTGLAREGHEVLLVAPSNSKVPGNVDLHGTTQNESEMAAYSGYWPRLRDYDVIIDHSWQKWSYLLKTEGKLPAPILGVCHAPIDTMYRKPPPVELPCFVGISQDQSAEIDRVLGVPSRYAYNGIDLDFYKAGPRLDSRADERYLFLARISSIKGPQLAIDLARKLRFGLDVVGDDKITNEPELAQRVRALSTHNIKFWGGVSRARAVQFFSASRALIHPAFPFREPFGLTLIEAQACGLPVLASDNGACRELIVHGKTGFAVPSIERMESLLSRGALDELKSSDCRDNAARFSVDRMVKRYVELCEEASDTGGW